MGMRSSRETGAVLLVVVLLLGLVAAMATAFVVTMRSHTKAAANAITAIQAETLADAGIRLGFLDLTRRTPRPEDGESPQGNRAWSCALPEAWLHIIIEDEGGKVDLNGARPDLLSALLRGAGVSPDDADRTAAAIIDFRDADDRAQEGGGEHAVYDRAGVSHGPKNGLFETPDELAQVPGISPAVYRRLRPFLTVYSRRPGIDESVAPAELVTMLSDPGVVAAGGNPSLPVPFKSPSARQAFKVIAQAHLAGGGVSTRESIVTLAGSKLSIRSWKTGTRRDISRPDNLSPC